MTQSKMKNGVYRRGETWSAHARVTDPATGERKTVTKGGFDTQDKAIAWREGTQTDDRRGERQKRGQETLGEYLEEWLGLVDVSAKTLVGYRSNVEGYIIPRIGGLRLVDVDATDLTRFYQGLRRNGRRRGDVGGELGLPAINSVHRTMRSALTAAVKADKVKANVAFNATLPKPERPTTRAEFKKSKVTFRKLSPEEIERFLVAASRHRLGAFFALAAHTGARRGEMLYLRWEDLHLDEKIVEFTGSRTVAGRRVVEGPTKTGHDRRVAISDDLVATLRQHRKEQMEEQIRAGELWRGVEDFVFTQQTGEPVHPDTPSKLMSQLCAAAGVPRVRLHDLRHSHASLLFDVGIGAHEIADRLGHSTTRTTIDTYVHADQDPNPHLANVFADMVGSGASTSPGVATA